MLAATEVLKKILRFCLNVWARRWSLADNRTLCPDINGIRKATADTFCQPRNWSVRDNRDTQVIVDEISGFGFYLINPAFYIAQVFACVQRDVLHMYGATRFCVQQ